MAHHSLLPIKNHEVMPEEFTEGVIRIIYRILSDPAVLGIVYYKKNYVQLCTVPSNMRRGLTTMLPRLGPIIHQAITEIDVLDELVAYRITSKTCEILVTGGKDLGAVVVQTRAKKKRKKLF